MSRYIALSATAHRHEGWLKYADYSFAQHESLLPLVADELPHALATMPIGFRKTEKGRFELVGVMSLEAQQNLFVHPDGRWIGGYKPAVLRGYPFRLLPEQDGERLVLCFDDESGLRIQNVNQQGESFFAENGELSPLLAKILDFLTQYEKQRRLVQQGVDALAKQQLIIPWEIKVQDNDNVTPLEGLYRVDEAALHELPSIAFDSLNKRNAISVAYAQLFSQHRISVLSRLYQLRADLNKADTQEVSLDALFDKGEDFGFDFDS